MLCCYYVTSYPILSSSIYLLLILQETCADTLNLWGLQTRPFEVTRARKALMAEARVREITWACSQGPKHQTKVLEIFAEASKENIAKIRSCYSIHAPVLIIYKCFNLGNLFLALIRNSTSLDKDTCLFKEILLCQI